MADDDPRPVAYVLGVASRLVGWWVVLVLAGALPVESSAAAQALHPCAAAATRCDGTIDVPLDWSDPASERIRVAFAWVPRGDRSRPATGTILLNPGGPGEAIGGVSATRRRLGPVLRRQNLLVVDPRGFGKSSPLVCEGMDARRPASIRACAMRLGGRARFFSSDQAVADMNAVRHALGVPAVTFHGVSYGTLLAQAFATRFPDRTTAVFLDSVIGTGADGYSTQKIASAVRLGMRGFGVVCRASRPCRARARRLRDTLPHVVRRLRTQPDRQVPLFSLGSLTHSPDEPVLGRELTAAVAANLHGDRAPLRRLIRLLGPWDGSPPPDLPAYSAYTCGDSALPFDRNASPSQRRRQLERSYARRRPAWPFTVDEWLGPIGGDVADKCVHWLDLRSRPPVPPGASYPPVPVLAVGGQFDTGTPTADGIVFRDGPAGRRPGLAAGPDVWQIIGVLRGSDERGEAAIRHVADWLNLPLDQVRAAVRYYSAHKDEIDEWIRRNDADAEEAESAWLREQELPA